MEASDLRRPKELEAENTKLKRMVDEIVFEWEPAKASGL